MIARILGLLSLLTGAVAAGLGYLVLSYRTDVLDFFTMTPIPLLLLFVGFLGGGLLFLRHLVCLLQAKAWLGRASARMLFPGATEQGDQAPVPIRRGRRGGEDADALHDGDGPAFDQASLFHPPALLRACILGDNETSGLVPSSPLRRGGYSMGHGPRGEALDAAVAGWSTSTSRPSLRGAQVAMDRLRVQYEEYGEVLRYINVFLGVVGLATVVWLSVGAVGMAVSNFDATLGYFTSGLSLPRVIAAMKANLAEPARWLWQALFVGALSVFLVAFLRGVDALCEPLRRRVRRLFEAWALGLVQNASGVAPLKNAAPEALTANLSYPSAVLTSLVESLEAHNMTVLKGQSQQQDLFQHIQGLADRIASLTDQTRVEQQLMMKLAEGQIALQDGIQRINESALGGDLGFDKVSRNHIKTMSRYLQQLVEALSAGVLTRDIRHELRIIAKTMGLQMPAPRVTSSAAATKSPEKKPSSAGAPALGVSASGEAPHQGRQADASGRGDQGTDAGTYEAYSSSPYLGRPS